MKVKPTETEFQAFEEVKVFTIMKTFDTLASGYGDMDMGAI